MRTSSYPHSTHRNSYISDTPPHPHYSHTPHSSLHSDRQSSKPHIDFPYTKQNSQHIQHMISFTVFILCSFDIFTGILNICLRWVGMIRGIAGRRCVLVGCSMRMMGRCMWMGIRLWRGGIGGWGICLGCRIFGEFRDLCICVISGLFCS